MNEKFKKQVCPRTQMQKANRGNVNYTSVSRTLHIKSPLIRHKIFRSCFLCTIIQFTDVLMQMQLIAIHFKHVTFQVHCANGTFRYTTLTVSVEYTNPGHQKHGWQPELWIHSEVNVGANCCTQIKYRSTQLTMLRLSWIWIFSQINTSIYTLEGEVNPKRFCCFDFLRPPPVERINIKHMNVFCSIKLRKTNHRQHQEVTLHFICVIETSVESRKLDIGRVLPLLFYEPRHSPGPIKSTGRNYFH